MAGIDDLFKGNLGTGLAVAVGAAVLGPIVLPALGQALKPVVKGAIKGGIVVYGWGRESLAEMREFAEDTYAEARAEMVHGEEEGEGLRARARGRSKTRSEASEEAVPTPS